jgi:ABC-type dipeptide/oligopeptide/nickel transport system permease subunit
VAAPIEVSGSEKEAHPEDVLQGMGGKAIQGRSLGQIAFMRLKRDKVAMGGGVVCLLLIIAAAVMPYIVGSPLAFNQDKIDPILSRPIDGPWHSGISWDHPFGLEPLNGRDIFARIMHGAQYSLLIAFFATMLSVFIGTVLGVTAGYFGGWVDAFIARLMDVFLAFPLLLFAIALSGVFPDQAFGLKGNALDIVLLIFIIGFFSWPYIGRIIRGQTLSLREREFVDAARSLGARPGHILLKELLPNLWGPILVYSTLLIPTNIIFEAALSFLGVGLQRPTPTWGSMLSDATGTYQFAPHFMIVPGLAIFIAVMAFNLFGDGLRDALDPRATR